jgi:hypothetical protein
MPSAPHATNSLEYYQLLRGQLEHEDNLIANRLNWFLTSQSFLFTAYAILGNGIVPSPGAGPDPRHQLVVIIPLIAGATCFLIFLAILSGIWAIHNLVVLYQLNTRAEDAERFPPLSGHRSTQFFGMMAPVLLPLLFMGVWCFLLFRHLF